MLETARATIALVEAHRALIAEIRYTGNATMIHIVVCDTNGAGIAEGALDAGEFILLRDALRSKVAFVNATEEG